MTCSDIPSYDQNSLCQSFTRSSSAYIDLNGTGEAGSVSYERECGTVYIGGFGASPNTYIYRINLSTDEIYSRVLPRRAYRMVIAGDYIWTAGPTGSVGACYLQKVDKNTLESVWENNTAFDDVRALVFDGTYIWAADRGTGQRLHRINPATNEITSYTGIVQAGARHMCFDGTYLWISCSDSNSVVRVNPLDRTYTVVGSLTGAWGICYDGSDIIVAGATGNIYRINPGTAAVTLSNTISGCSWLCHADYDGTYVWAVDNTNNNVRIINPADLTLVDTKATQTKPGKSHYDGMYHWVLHENSLRLLKLTL